MSDTDLDERDRLRALVGAGIALSSERSLDELLKRLVETAATLTGARYAALGVIDSTGEQLERFITTGIDEAQVEQMAGLPGGRSFLRIPVLLRGIAYGNLYLTEKHGGADFEREDEELVGLLAAQAAVAIENARLYEATDRWSSQLEALNEIGTALAEETDLPAVLDLITRRLREVIDARLVAIAVPRADGSLIIEAADGESADQIRGLQLERTGSKSGRVLERRRGERVDSLLDDPEVDYSLGEPLSARSGLYVPLIAHDQAIGVIVAHDKVGGDPRFSNDDLRLTETFATRAAVAVDQSRRVASDALRRVVEAQELERRRLARELHDQTGQELTGVLLSLKAIEDAKDPAALASAVASVRAQVVETLNDVRRLAVELRPKVLDDYGLAAALERLAQTFAEQTGLVLDLETQLGDERFPSDVETALYRMVQEALTNVVKHGQANHVSVILARSRTTVTAVIEDDGRGFETDQIHEGMGLAGMRERLALLDGKLKIESRPGGGTTLVGEVPLT